MTDLWDAPAVIELEPHADDRGSLTELWKNSAFYLEGGFTVEQVNITHSRLGVLRGLHYSRKPQGKLIVCVAGQIQDVAVDLRVGSPTFGLSTTANLNDTGGRAFWVPPGFGHGFLTLSPVSTVVYLLTSEHSPEDEDGVYALNPSLNVPWLFDEFLGGHVFTMSDRDRDAVSLMAAMREGRLPVYKEIP